MSKLPPFLSEVAFGAFLAYSPRGQSDISRKSRRVRDAVKHDTPGFLQSVVELLRDELPKTQLGMVLDQSTTLVPCPRSAPLVSADALWPGKRICDELVGVGLGRDVLTCPSRARSVPKSAFAARGERATIQDQAASMKAQPVLLAPEKITIVDDFITKGTTLLAASSLVAAVFPGVALRTFALVRTLGLVPDVDRIVDPCAGTIRLIGSEVRRDP